MVNMVSVPRVLFRVLTCAAVALLCLVAPAQASTIIDFMGGVGGTVSYGGSGGSLVGSNIAIDTLLGINTPANGGGHDVTAGYLNFQSGTLLSYDGSTDTYTFNGGGSFTITGGVSDAGISSTTGGLPTVLLSGSFLGATIGPSGALSLFTGSGTDTKNPNLVAWFGLPADSKFVFGPATTHVDVNGGALDGGAFSGATSSTDVSNTVVPEPGSMMLFGSGLVGLSTLVRRRRHNKSIDVTTNS